MFELSLQGSSVEGLFPFFIFFDLNQQILAVGHRLAQMLPGLPEQGLEEAFQYEYPVTSGENIDFSSFAHSIFLLRSRSNPLILLRGQVVTTPSGHFFACYPWVTAMEDLVPLGLGLNDFAPHNAVPDFLVAVKTKDGTVQELDGLAQNLVRQREELRFANRMLQVQHELHELLDSATDFEGVAGGLLGMLGTAMGWDWGIAWRRDRGATVLATWGAAPKSAGPSLVGLRLPKIQAPLWHPGAPSVATQLCFPLPGTIVLEWHTTRPGRFQNRDNLLLADITQTLENMSERWAVARQLRHAEARRATVLQAALDAIVTVNSFDHILEFNPAAERLLPTIALTEPLPEVLSDYLTAEAYQALSATPTPMTIANSAGQVQYLDVVRLQAPIDGEVVHTIFIRDVTEARKNEAVLRQAAEVALAADQAKTNFLAKFSHELRTPLNAVQGMADIAIHSGAMGDVRECLERIQINTMALTSLINDILDTSKIENGEFDLDDRPVDVWELVDQAGDGLAFKATQKGLDFFWSVDAHVPLRVRGDMQRMRQILANLLSNAIKFTDQGYVRAMVWVEDGCLVFQVEDTGIGIAPEDLAKVGSQPYWRSARTKDYQGTGLGMTITQSLVNLMGGRLNIQSEVGRGSTFRVWLPLHPIPGTTKPSQPHDIWVFLTDELIRRHVVQILGAAGFPVTEITETGQPGTPSLLIGAVDCPTFRRLASVLQPRGTKILAVTSLGHRSEGQDDIDARVVKPFGNRRLLDVVARLLEPTQSPNGESTPPGEVEVVQHRPRILVVEDNPDNQQLAVHALSRAGYRVYSAENGAVGFFMASQQDFALILMDIEMPEMDGFEATRRIRALEEQENRTRTPIIALTAHAVEGYRQFCLDAGMDEYVTKPIQRKRLVELVAAKVDPRPTALIVDDSMDNREILRRYLERDGRVRPICVTDGDAALRLAKRHPFDVVIVDKEMPRMDGLELLQKLLQLDPTTRCIVLTGHTSMETKRKVLDAGALRFVSKPIDRALFIGTVLQVLAIPLSVPSESP